MARHRAKHGLKQPSGFDLRPRRLRESHNLYKCQPGIMEWHGKETVFLSSNRPIYRCSSRPERSASTLVERVAP